MEAKADRSIRRGTSRKDFEEAQQALSKALGEIGYSTWAAFRMGNGLTTISPAKLDEHAHALEEHAHALEELDRAKTEHAELMGGVEQATELQRVLSAIDSALDHAVALLARDPYAEVVDGEPNLLPDALRSQTIDAGSICIDRDDALSSLWQVLEEAGCCGDTEVNSEPGLVALAKSWLAVLESADVAAVRSRRDRERAATELDGLSHPAAGPHGGCLDHERGAVHAAEAAVAVHREALLDVNRARIELHTLLATELALAEEHDAKREQLERERVSGRMASGRFDDIAGDQGGIGALAAAVPRGLAGPIPLIVLMGNAPLTALESMLELPDNVQILVLGDTEGMAEWTAALP
ncbi:MAG: hypothetical protein P8L16_07985 [Ilumatobacter sp.]|nr:hypothetical protein [Ilumatobacter sp.]